MTRPAPIRLLDRLAPLLGLKSNLPELDALHRSLRLKEPDIRNPQALLKDLNLLGEPLALSFQSHRLTEIELSHMLELGVMPAIFFLKTSTPAPVLALITMREGNTLNGYWYPPNSNAEEPLSISMEDFLQGLDQSDDRFLVFTPTKVNSGISPHGKHPSQGLSPLQRMWRLLGTERKDILFIYIYAIAAGLLSLTTPLGVQAIIGLISGGLILEPVVVLIGFVIFGTLMGGILQILLVSIVEVIEQRLFARVAFEFAYRMPRIRMSALYSNYAPELMNRFFDVLTIQKGFAKILTDVLASLLQIFFGLLLLSLYHPIFIAFSILLIVLVFLIFRYTWRKGLETSIAESRYKFKAVQWIEEVARTLGTFKLAGHTNMSLDRMDREVAGYLDKRKQHFKVLITQYSAIVGFKVLITATLLILGSVLVINRQITLGQFVASEIVIITLLVAVEKIILSLDTIYDVLTAVDKIGTVTDLPLESNEGVFMEPSAAQVTVEHIQGLSVRIRDLQFSYPGRPLISGLSLDIPTGKCVGITGSAGSGKSTLLSIISGLYTDYTGSLTYDGLSLRDINLASLRDCIGEAVSPEDIIYGTLEENICMHKPVSAEQLRWALDQAEITNWMNRQPNGLKTILMPGGSNVSASLARKIILARAIVEKPRLLVLDEFFNALDPDFTRRIIDFLTDPAYGWTVVCVTRNTYFLERCDHVVLMDNGTIQFQGSYAEGAQTEPFRSYISPLLP
ncbi:MAG: ATP-binding cassette domain-containing protein [Bacteroidetes bacterium]|nr:ATP-binding cassette domain-containing protein [Bacteroidota bacterium]